jgi:hypothetical protein
LLKSLTTVGPPARVPQLLHSVSCWRIALVKWLKRGPHQQQQQLWQARAGKDFPEVAEQRRRWRKC